MNQCYRLGIDIGSTTVKVAVIDDNNKILFADYERHYANIQETLASLLKKCKGELGELSLRPNITGSGGLTLSGYLHIPFVQEVVAVATALQDYAPRTDVAIELGGEDAKIIYFTGGIDQRMNGICAGGTGSFIDQMASLLQTDAAGLNEYAKNYKAIYPIAARCGVFAKSDIQPLINDGATREDLAASIFQAVVNQTISGLACGKPIRGNVAFLGGPLHFLPELRNAFIRTLNLTGDAIIAPDHSHLFAATGATMNIMMAAALAQGDTVIENAAKEPHIVDLANFLNSMGADIRGAGTDTIKIRGVERLSGGSYAIIPDQIEAGTYMAAVAATGGQILVKNIIPKHMDCITAKLQECGVEVEEQDDTLLVRRTARLKKANVKTLPYPGFPTDMQPQMTTVLTLAQGTSLVTEGVWSSRYRYVDELKRMGARIQVDDKTAVVEGVEKLTGAPIQAYDLRAGAALVIAALAAEGESEISNVQYIERGYEDIIGKLRALGADIRAVEEPDEDALSTAQIS